MTDGIDDVGAGVVFAVEPNENLPGAGVAASFDGCGPTDKDTAGAGADDLLKEKDGVSETEGGAAAPNDGAPNTINGIDGVGAGVAFDVEPNEKLPGAGVTDSLDGCGPTDNDTAGAGADDLLKEKAGVSETDGGTEALINCFL